MDDSQNSGVDLPHDGVIGSPVEGIDHTTPGDEKNLNHLPAETSQGTTTDEKLPKKSLRFKLTILNLCTVSVVGAMDAVIVAACLSEIAKDFNSSSVDIFWVGTSFLLTQSVMIPIFGSLSDIFGRKYPIILALLLFLLGSILCATAQSINWLIGARVVQGLGAGGTLNLVSVIMSDMTTLKERGQYMALGAASWAVGTIIGVPLGGAIATYSTWRIAFWINIPLLVVPIVGLWFFLNLTIDVSSFTSKLARVDYLGITIFSGASCAFLLGLTTGGTVHPWASFEVLVPMILGIIGYIAFILIEWKVAKEPMIPLRVFAHRSSASGFFSAFIHGLCLWCFIYYFIIFFLGALQHGLFHSSLETLASTAYTAPAGMMAGIIIRRTLRFRTLLWAGWVLFTFGTGLTALMTPDSNGGILYGIRIFAALGGGFLFVAPLVAVQASQQDQDVGIATSLISFFRSIGQAFGVAIGGVIFQNQWTIQVAKGLADESIPANYAIDSSAAEVAYEIIAGFPEPIQQAYRYVYADSLRTVWYILTAIAGVGLLSSLFARNESLNRNTASKQQYQERGRIAEKSEEDV